MTWIDRAACRNENPDLFFPERGESSREAKDICRPCPVKVECIDYAMRHRITYGIWGGLSERQRKTMRRAA